MGILIAIILVGIVIFLLFTRAKRRGAFGEKQVSIILATLPSGYKVFNNVYLQYNDRTVQIDHIVVSEYGIFIVETKNYSGLITGTDNSEQWVEHFYGKKYKFYNPIKQNKGHIYTLHKLIGTDIEKFISIVVFLDKATLRCHTDGIVIYDSELRRTILEYNTTLLNDYEIQNFISRLTKVIITNKEIESVHVNSVNEKIRQNSQLIKQGICPKCGGRLVERTGSYGPFMGCSNYPRCNFTTHK